MTRMNQTSSPSPSSTLTARLRASLNRIWAVVAKEYLTLLMDKGARAILILPVIVQSLLFGYGATFNLDNVPWVLLDESRTEASAGIVRAIEGTGIFDLTRSARGMAEFKRTLDRGDALVGLVFPNDFAQKRELYAVLDARNSTTAGVAAGYVNTIVASVNAHHGAAGPVTIVERLRWNENAVTRHTIVPSLILALSLIQVLLLAGFTVSREREEGFFDMMLMTPASSLEILVGKAVVPLLIAMVQAFLIFSVAVFWFEIPFSGNFFSMGVLVASFAFAFVGLGLAISALAKTIQQSLVMVILVMLPTIILSGLLTSVRAMPPALELATRLNPLRCAIEALRMIYFEGAGILDTLHLYPPVGLTTIATLLWASWLFRHKIV